MRTFGLPRDPAAWIALGLASLLLVAALLRAERIGELLRARPRRAVAILAAIALGLSWAYLHYYLRGGPRIIDATSYWLEARGLARGYFAFPVVDPSGSFRGRFLLTPPGSTALGVLFPPGYPAILALGFLAGAPLAVGPIIGAALVAATWALARAWLGRDDLALTAAGLSVACAALRYHAADTMSHGWAALLLTTALAAAHRGGRAALVSGFAVGWLIATRPVTGIVGALFVVLLVKSQGRALLGWTLAAALPGLGLLALHQHALTGSWLRSSQLAYYALADGPPGCFRYGFGAGIGCHFEHGDFVQAHLANGFGIVAALGTSARRLWLHMGDVLNAWPLFLILPWVAWSGRHERSVRLGVCVIVALMVAYVPFYFDGSYPGGGARLFAEALPMEHVLVAWGLGRLRIQRFAPAALLAAFALHRSRDHEALRDREGGRPMFERAVLDRAGVDRGLVFTNTDHGFNLAHVPGAKDASRELVVARWRGDAHDAAIWIALGRPSAYRYVYSVSGEPAALVPVVPEPSTLIEAGGQWPPLGVSEGWAHPAFASAACSEGRFGLRLVGPARITIEVPTPTAGTYRLIPRWVPVASGLAGVELHAGTARWQASWDAEPGDCRETPGPETDLGSGASRLEIRTFGSDLVLDTVEARPAVSARPVGKKR